MDVEASCRGLILSYYSRICLEELRKITRNFSQDSRSLGRDLKPGPPHFETGVLTTLPRHSVDWEVEVRYLPVMISGSREVIVIRYLHHKCE
jgi:hypothetical protein